MVKFIRKYGLYVLVLGVVLFLGGCRGKSDESAQKEFEIDRDYKRGPLLVHVRVSESKINIAQTLLLELEAAIGEGYEVTMPRIDEALQSFGLVDWRNIDDKLDENNNVVKTYNYRLEPLLSGTFEIPAFVFEFTETAAAEKSEGEKTHQLETEPIEIVVTSLLGEDRAQLVIADIDDVVGLAKKGSVWPIAAAGIIVAGAAIIVLLRFKKRKATGVIRVYRPAHEVAYERLAALVKAKLIEAARLKEFYGRISNILRHYIEDRFELRAPERTTEEFLFELQYTKELSGSDKGGLKEFLQHCDLVKFARHKPTNEQIQKTFDLVKNFIEKTKSDQRRIDVTGMDSKKMTEVA